jgi:serine/threonine protein kinase
MFSSSPHQLQPTQGLKVNIDCKSSFSFNSVSGTPSNASNVSNDCYPDTPIISDNISYTNTHGQRNTPQPPITPVTPDTAHTQKLKYSNDGQFPDTMAVNNIELDKIDEKKQLAHAQKQRQPPPQPQRPPPANTGTSTNTKKTTKEHKKKRPKKFTLVEKVEKNTDKLEAETLRKHGYIKYKYIADTLQGCTFMAKRSGDGSEVVIKSTKKELYARGITISKEGKAFNIREDIVAEGRMMRYFMNNNPPSSLIAFYDFFEDESRYYLVMENGGIDFFDFVVRCHDLINTGKLSMKEWRKQCKFMFAQIIQCIKWLHDVMHYCHLDISLENILISQDAYFDENTGKLNKCYVKFIDFGLAEGFDLSDNPFYLSKKYVGKTHYKSPKVYAKKEEFRANKADIWSLGVCLFMMIIGAPPYNKPHKKDAGYRFIAEEKITKLLYSWNRIKYVTPNLYDLMERMLCCDEKRRISMTEIVRHDWLKIYFPNETKRKISPLSPPMSPASRSPLSPSLSSKMSGSGSFNSQHGSGSGNTLNIMIPQQAVSMGSHSHSKPRKASGSYQYVKGYKSCRRATTPSSTASANKTPTPIIESRTSSCYPSTAAVDFSKGKKKKEKR